MLACPIFNDHDQPWIRDKSAFHLSPQYSRPSKTPGRLTFLSNVLPSHSDWDGLFLSRAGFSQAAMISPYAEQLSHWPLTRLKENKGYHLALQ